MYKPPTQTHPHQSHPFRPFLGHLIHPPFSVNSSPVQRTLSAFNTIIRISSHLLSAPASIRFPHIRWRLNTRDELKGNIRQSSSTDDGTHDVESPVVLEDEAADKEIEDAAADEGEEKRSIAGYLGRDLELEQGGGCFVWAGLVRFGMNGWGRNGEREESVQRPKIIT